MLKLEVHQKKIERTIHKDKVHSDVMGIILILKCQIRGSVKTQTRVSNQFYWGNKRCC